MPRRPAHYWLPEEDDLLGTTTDIVIAERLGLSHNMVQSRRSALGILPHGHTNKRGQRYRPRHQWTAEEDALLGTVSDRELGRRLDLDSQVVRHRRITLNIAPAGPVGPPVKYWTPERDALLGTMSDGEVAKKLDICYNTVTQRRRKLGIPAFRPPRGDRSLIPIDGEKVRLQREALGVSRYVLSGRKASLAGHLGKLEDGSLHAVTPKTMRKLCRLLRCKPEELSSD